MDTVTAALEEAALRFKYINEVTSLGGSEIQKFYQNSVIFVTGANGFMGKLLVEKLLRACNVKKIYILLRGKKGKTILDRLNDMKKDPIFDYLRETQPAFGDKISPVEGDVADIRLGICDQDWWMLIEQVDTIFHLAATTRFDENLLTSTLINTRGTREALHLAKQCPELRAFVHVSTAYCHATSDKIGVLLKEEVYPCPIPPDTLINLAETIDASRMESIRPQFIEGWPNTYAFTKAVAEELVRSTAKELPICIIRAPIVISSYQEPTPGWLNTSCIYGPSGMIVAIGLGLKRLFCMKENEMVCLIPGDYLNNTVLAAAWDCVKKREGGDKDVKIYTVSSSKCNVRFSTISSNILKGEMRKYVSRKAIWYCSTTIVESKHLYRILAWFLHYIPAFIVDLGMFILNVSKPKGIKSFMNVYKKIDKMEAAYDYFLRKGWCFDDKNVVQLYQNMSPPDQTIFNVDVTTIKWDHMIYIWSLGVKKYILNDSKMTDNYAIIKQKVFKFASYVILLLYLYVFYYIFKLWNNGFK